MPEIAAGGGGTCEESGEGVGSGVCQELICRFVNILGNVFSENFPLFGELIIQH